jgi:hypothetical protein
MKAGEDEEWGVKRVANPLPSLKTQTDGSGGALIAAH